MMDLRQTATWAEIHAQPAIWKDWGANLDVEGIKSWIAAQNVAEVWFCGAGTSAFVGDILVAGLEGQEGPRLRSVPTTDIVSRPYAFLKGPSKLVVNFGRSGNSAETLGTLAALDELAPHWPRLNITCNHDSALATDPVAKVVLLPATTHDVGFAMTSSFSTMFLTALSLFDRSCATFAVSSRLVTLSAALSEHLPKFHAASATLPRPERAVFVGSGALAFAAREAALKVLELSAGQIPTLWDSSLGFRHGPKSFVLPGTAIWVFLSDEPHARAYDTDLVTELRAQFPQNIITTTSLPHPFGDLWSAPLYVAQAQVLAAVWSQKLNLPVDDPFAGRGTLSRVVSGVRLHKVGRT